jgi:ABC-type polysaccharide/polyol phosphate transport system ATPase subunit
MTQPVITARGLSKRYLIGHQISGRGTSFRDAINRGAKSIIRNAADVLRGRQIVQGDSIEEFWALKELDFEVMLGEVLGLVGRNGAGKSTLLKILSRITSPTAGRVTLRGRVGSLLEVGTGFHSELTGRENIFLNGAILGMKRSEIRKKFDEIVDFAGVEQFLDTPVKHYSSGMYVRLAFSVAAHLETDILIVDEVLAVGDAEFQKKCLGKMDEVSQSEGRTTLFVTHNMETMLKVCTRAILLENGSIELSGSPQHIVNRYLSTRSACPQVVDLRRRARKEAFRARMQISEVSAPSEVGAWTYFFGDDVAFDLHIDSQASFSDVEIALGIFSARGFEVASWSNVCQRTTLSVEEGPNSFRLRLDRLKFLPGQYSIGIALRTPRGAEDYVEEAVRFEIVQNEEAGRVNAHMFGGVLIPDISISNLTSTSSFGAKTMFGAAAEVSGPDRASASPTTRS